MAKKSNLETGPARTSDKSFRGNASQFFVAGELCRRGHAAVVTLGNTPNVDILCSNAAGTRFAHIQVKTFRPGDRSCTVGLKAERDFGPTFFWVLGGIRPVGSEKPFEYYIIPASEMAKHVSEAHKKWLATPGRGNRPHKDNKVRVVYLPPYERGNDWDVSQFLGRWDLIDKVLNASEPLSVRAPIPGQLVGNRDTVDGNRGRRFATAQ